ncbi:hypothetical protein CEXT_673431 [Caerostris extrusa]|uniref:Uncharacterized protein n=1 Tax=Caerostris extrusa TaxID=172846 RepID=A0AAV4TQI7_CAEEX|nr:hypothetical protein CEXT_673431 [Caerostris extrusa]
MTCASHIINEEGAILPNDPKCLSIGGLCVDEISCPQESRANQSALCNIGPKAGVCCFRSKYLFSGITTTCPNINNKHILPG